MRASVQLRPRGVLPADCGIRRPTKREPTNYKQLSKRPKCFARRSKRDPLNRPFGYSSGCFSLAIRSIDLRPMVFNSSCSWCSTGPARMMRPLATAVHVSLRAITPVFMTMTELRRSPRRATPIHTSKASSGWTNIMCRRYMKRPSEEGELVARIG